jgi:hypothetical protein
MQYARIGRLDRGPLGVQYLAQVRHGADWRTMVVCSSEAEARLEKGWEDAPLETAQNHGVH